MRRTEYRPSLGSVRIMATAAWKRSVIGLGVRFFKVEPPSAPPEAILSCFHRSKFNLLSPLDQVFRRMRTEYHDVTWLALEKTFME